MNQRMRIGILPERQLKRLENQKGAVLFSLI